MDLQRIVGIAPGDARGQQLGHAGLDVAAAVGILLARGEVGELAGDHGLDGHPGDLPGDARKRVQRLGELDAVLGVAQAEFERVLRHADGAGRGLDTGALEGRHELLEALPLFLAQQVSGRHLEPVEADLVFLHAAIAQHPDLAAAHALGGERLGVGAARLLREEHRQALIAGLGGIAARQQGHDIGARGVGDPGLVAVDLIRVALEHGAGAQAGQVRTGVGFGKDRRRQQLARRDARQVLLLLRLGAAGADQLGRDLGTRAERADADIAARQFLGDDAHGELAHAQPTPLLGDGQAEDAEIGHLLHHRQRDQLVAQVPAMGVRRHFGIDETAELTAHLVERLVIQPERAEAAGVETVRNELGDAAAHRRRVAGDQLRDGGRLERRTVEPEIARPHDLDLADGDAALELGEIFAIGRLQDQTFEFAARARFGPAPHLAQRRHIGRDPGKAVRGELLTLQQLRIDLALRRHHRPHRFAHSGLMAAGRVFGFGAKRKKVVQQHGSSPVWNSSPPRSGGEEGAHCAAMGR